MELALGHVTYGLAGHYGDWVRAQVSSDQFESYHHAHRRGEVSFGGNAYDWDIPLSLHNSVWTAERTIAFIESHDQQQPFFLAIGFQDPHHPHAVPVELTARVNPTAVPLPRYVEGELEDKPPHFHAARRGELEGSGLRGEFAVAGQGHGADYRHVSEADARLGRAYYYSMVRLIDQQMGRILDCLERNGLAEDTLIVFTTDHGELLGDHGLWMKGPFHYEELLRIPMIVRWPRGIPAGQRVCGLISQVDVVPTIISALGLEIPAEIDGVDALPLLRGEMKSVRDAALVECVDDPRHLRLKTVVTENLKLTYYHGYDFGELYDLRADPDEIHNLWHDPRYAAQRQMLMARILDHMEPLERRAPRYCYA
jgi:arylsulfatase A-like enzyme